ncbi:5'-nucleotidase [Candidatus Halobonum tyrrellensis G22]|uniref:5'-nucleotidase n=1 Tax=Candidatus Halobonum tyrrellensis G22 TaxID=1324957 RepID=V4GPB1_9EURY|nr:5'-nucleotidase [Candidatus Halobonum tyrrellensis G22]
MLALLAGTGTAAADAPAAVGDALAGPADVASGFESVRLTELGRYESNLFDEGGAEIIAYHAPTARLFVVNADLGGVDVLDVSDPTTPTKVADIDVAGELDGVDTANSVSASDDLVAVAIGADTPQEPGQVGLYDPESLDLRNTVTVGALPDKVTFTPDGTRALVANEAEPNDEYTTDPKGSVSIVDVSGGAASATVATAGFEAFVGREEELRDRGIRVFGPDATAAQDFEPEYVAVSDDSETAWVALQENNAIAEIDVDAAEVTDLWALGFKDYSLAGNELDASNEDGGVNVRNWPIHGILQPDAIAAYSPGEGDETYVVTANEGDSRDYDGFSEEAEVADLDLDPEAFDFDAIEGVDSVEELQAPENLGPKGVTTTLGDTDGDGLYEEIYAFGGRSFSIFTADGERVFDSGSDFEDITAQRYADEFNNDNTENTGDSRSDNKGPEPEGLTLGRIGDRFFAFVGLERVGGVMVYEITDPESPTFVDYVNDRDFGFPIRERIADGDAPASAAGDLGPEGLDYASAEESPTDQPLVFVGHEVSGTTTIFGVEEADEPVPFQVDLVAGEPNEVLGESEGDFYGRQERLIQYVHGDADGVTERDTWINSLAAETRDCLGGYESIEVHGDVATVEFTVKEGCELTLSLVSYSLPDGEFSFDTAGEQEMAAAATATFEGGEHTLDVSLPTGGDA